MDINKSHWLCGLRPIRIAKAWRSRWLTALRNTQGVTETRREATGGWSTTQRSRNTTFVKQIPVVFQAHEGMNTLRPFAWLQPPFFIPAAPGTFPGISLPVLSYASFMRDQKLLTQFWGRWPKISLQRRLLSTRDWLGKWETPQVLHALATSARL